MIRPFLAIAFLAALSGTAAASAELDLRVERAIAFKDGHALFIRKGTATVDSEGRVHTFAVPERAVLGCLWAVAGDEPVTLIAEEAKSAETTTESRPAKSLTELLIANTGQSVELFPMHPEGTSVKGTVLAVLRASAGSVVPLSEPSMHSATIWPPDQMLVHFRMEDGMETIVPISSFAGIRGQSLKTQFEDSTTTNKVRKRLSVQFDAAMAGQEVEVTLLHIAPGLQWTPTYRLAGTLKQSSMLSLTGELMNSAEDLKDTEVDLVVGVPNIRFWDRLSPLTLENTLRQAVRSSARDEGQMMLSNALMSQVRLGGGADYAPPEAAPEMDAIGEQVSDLFVYPIGKVTLSKGSRMAMPIWDRSVAMRDVYTVTFETRAVSQRDAYNSYESARTNGSPSLIEEHPVWHQFELENKSGMPWTSGPVLYLSGQMPVGQDLLTYTPNGGKTLVPVTKAVNVRADLEEKETSRNPRGLEIDGTWYSIVEKTSTITVQNYHSEAINFRVKLEGEGRISAETDGAKVTTSDRSSGTFGKLQWPWLNPFSTATWDLTLAPGEKKVISCSVRYHAR